MNIDAVVVKMKIIVPRIHSIKKLTTTMFAIGCFSVVVVIVIVIAPQSTFFL